MFISIIVPTFKRVNQAVKTIKLINKALHQLSYRSEIIIIDNSPDIKIKKNLAKINSSKFRYYRSFEKNVARSKNFGAKKARGDIIIFCDSDIEISSDTIINTIKHFVEHKTAAAVGGQVLWKNNPSSRGKDRPRKEDRIIKINNTYFIEALYSRYFATYKKIFLSLGGYEEQVFGMHGEGSDLSIRYWRAGFPLTYNPKIKVHHVFDAPDSIALRISHPEWKIAKDYLLLAYKYGLLSGENKNYSKTIAVNFQVFKETMGAHIIQGIGNNLSDICKAKEIIDKINKKDNPFYNFKFLEVFSEKTQFLQCIKKSAQHIHKTIKNQ